MKDRELLTCFSFYYYIFDAGLNVGVSMIMNIWIIRSEF